MMNCFNNKKNKKVFVAMSGGVDSSVAAALLKKEGYEVIGVTMCFNIKRPKSRRPSCCGADGIEDAKRAAQILDIPHYVLNFAKDINKYIIEDFIGEYLVGRTPNPCVRCNQYIKFGSLFKKIRQLKGEYLATGHYAKIHYSKKQKKFELKKGKDKEKEQSYFLYGIKKEILPFVLFPLGDLTKKQVRSLAKKYGLLNAGKPASQDICFISDDGYQKFLEDRLGKEFMSPGPIKDENNKIVGEHKGIARYTIGQRDGLRVALGKPVYVYKIDKKTNTIYVGDNSRLYDKALIATGLNFFSVDFPKSKIVIKAKIRYNHIEVPASLRCINRNCVRVEFRNPQRAITPGQSVVFYKGDNVLGGGIIKEAIK